MTNEELIKYLEKEGYTDLRVLDDGSIVGVIRMLFTWGTVVDLEQHGHGGRVCWPTYEQAAHFAATMTTIDEQPPEGYTALKRLTDKQRSKL